MEKEAYYFLQLSTSGQRESWKFNQKEDALHAYRAIVEEFGHYEHENKSGKKRDEDRVHLKVARAREEKAQGETDTFAPEAWFKADAYPRILDWANRHIGEEEQ
ncbi:hypothetical protein [Planococcus chinensis]|uniref:Uncharacterized protein n=1 Tax=Planococcus chinensis TaxID=272917 RepID=A0ABW4QGR3_9BACL